MSSVHCRPIKGAAVTIRDGKMRNEIKVCRARRDMTQDELSRAMGVSRQTIIAIEKGRYDPSLPLAFRLAHYFGLDIEDIFIYDDAGD